jgi:hypothetical protein
MTSSISFPRILASTTIVLALAVSAGVWLQPLRAATPAPASIQQTMLTKIDPASDALWASVGTVETAQGTTHRAPRSAAGWQKVSALAETLVAGARHLQRPGLPVGATAHSRLADADTPGTRTAPQIAADIRADPARFARHARALEEAALSARAAARARNAEGLITAGAAIDAACEACHAAYWYPRTPPLALPDPDHFGASARHP